MAKKFQIDILEGKIRIEDKNYSLGKVAFNLGELAKLKIELENSKKLIQSLKDKLEQYKAAYTTLKSKNKRLTQNLDLCYFKIDTLELHSKQPKGASINDDASSTYNNKSMRDNNQSLDNIKETLPVDEFNNSIECIN